MLVASKTEDYQLFGDVLEQGLKELRYSREDLNVELFASDKQHVLDLYCSKGQNCCWKLCLPSFRMAYGNPRFSELWKVLTKVAGASSRPIWNSKHVMILCLLMYFLCNLQGSLCFQNPSEPKSFTSTERYKSTIISQNSMSSHESVYTQKFFNVQYLQMRCSWLSKCLSYFTFRRFYMRARSH